MVAPEGRCRRGVKIRGQVQGVGFRPFVFGLAARLGLSGWVRNDGGGVTLEIQGRVENVYAFLEAVERDVPPLARIIGVELADLPLETESGFAILGSESGQSMKTAIGADAAVCDACLAELFNPADRRYRYPFLNCTQCGPRYTLTRRLPYDRPQTSMAGFALCLACTLEYQTPSDRRFHAQPTCCPACGPRLSHPLEDIVGWLASGLIVALKGLGGFHLACDARNPETVARLRAVKQRDGKPFAVMVSSLAAARRLVTLSPVEAAALSDPARPILLARRRELDPEAALAPDLAPDLAWLGVMLPYTPLHYLLFHEEAGRPTGIDWLADAEGPAAPGLALVMTSANPGGEPLAIDNDEAARRLAGIADRIVDHDRDIVIRADDSVMRVVAGVPRVIRRGRGLVPNPISLAAQGPSVLAVGGHLKNAVCVTRGDQAFLSQHIGDLDTAAGFGFFEETVCHLLDSLEIAPVAVACDRHPDFLSSRFAEAWAAEKGVPCWAVQHHHAHLAAVVAEHRLAGPVLGLALDGFGLGDDGGAWGGELLWLEGGRCRRLGHLGTLAQPGGDRAAREPWRMAAAALHRMGREDEIIRRFGHLGPASALVRMLKTGARVPLTCSCGRWFDAACGLLGVRAVAGFEGEAPMVLESLVRTPRLPNGWQPPMALISASHDKGSPPVSGHDGGPASLWTRSSGVDSRGHGRARPASEGSFNEATSKLDGMNSTLDLLPVLEALLAVEDPVLGAELFHGALIAALVEWVAPIAAAMAVGDVVLGGGCLLNRVLAEGLVAGFAAHGLTAWLARAAPSNDGGLALGQAWVAVERL